MFHSNDGLYFDRCSHGAVKITKTDGLPPSEGGKVLFEQTLNADTWTSMVLTMTAFNERHGDFHAFKAHHDGERDMLVGQRSGY